MPGHAAVFHCPYCGDQDLWPHVTEPPGPASWECRSCLRVFAVSLLGQLDRPVVNQPLVNQPGPVPR